MSRLHEMGKTIAMKGQLLSTEVVLAFSMFLAALVVFLLSWSFISYSFASQEEELQMQLALSGISDALVLSPGDPSDWESTVKENASSFGLASEKNVLSDQKLSALQSLNQTQYDAVREKMGAGRHQVYIEARSGNGTLFYSFGRKSGQMNGSIASVTSERMAILNDSIAILKVEIWRQKGAFA